MAKLKNKPKSTHTNPDMGKFLIVSELSDLPFELSSSIEEYIKECDMNDFDDGKEVYVLQVVKKVMIKVNVQVSFVEVR